MRKEFPQMVLDPGDHPPGPVSGLGSAAQVQGPLETAGAGSGGRRSRQREVCHNTGCYHLQGDGVTAAHEWVWVPAGPPPRSRTRRVGGVGEVPRETRSPQDLCDLEGLEW
jgi:hypothetical protein